VIIFSCVKTNYSPFLSDKRRINVALTRAKYGMIIVGKLSNIEKIKNWKTLIDTLKHDHQIVNGAEEFLDFVKIHHK
jgi:superfamily I DNA and/or RNA helicase